MIDIKGLKLVNLMRKAIAQENANTKAGWMYSRQAYDAMKEYIDMVKYETVNQRKTQGELVRMVRDFMVGYYGEEDMYETTIRYRDIKHYHYYDQFLYKGAAKDIQDALVEHGLNSAFLKAVRKGQANDNNHWNTSGFNIIQEWSDASAGHSPTVIRFEIWYGDKLIYEYSAKTNNELDDFKMLQAQQLSLEDIKND